MDIKQSLLEDLNIEQQTAVVTDNQYTIVLAGAGSGKIFPIISNLLILKIRFDLSSGSFANYK